MLNPNRRLHLFLIASLLAQGVGLAQSPQEALRDFARAYLVSGSQGFDVMRMVPNRAARGTPAADEALDPSWLPRSMAESDHEQRAVIFKKVGTLELVFSLTDSVLRIRPAGNYYFPEIDVALISDQASLNGKPLGRMKTLHIQTPHNAFKSAWQGFRWLPAGGEEGYKLTLGRLHPSGRLYLEVQWEENGTRWHYRLLGQ